MSESPGKRFRRIISAWREDSEPAPRPAAPSTRPAPNPPAKSTSPPPVELSRQTPIAPARPIKPTSQPEPPRTHGLRGLVNTPPQHTPDDRPRSTAMPRSPETGPAASFHASSEVSTLAQQLYLGELKTPADAERFLERLRAKTSQTVQDFSDGVINQRQFQAIYSHYQRQRMAVEKALIEMPGSGAWRAVATEGHTSFLRQQHAAQVLSYAIYETASGLPVTHVGEFIVDDALLVPMLSTFRSSTQELFGAGMKRVELEGGRHLCYVPGRYTTLIVIFSAEPAAMQLRTIEDLHRDFEYVNQMNLSKGNITQLALTFTHLWAFDMNL